LIKTTQNGIRKSVRLVIVLSSNGAVEPSADVQLDHHYEIPYPIIERRFESSRHYVLGFEQPLTSIVAVRPRGCGVN
jgi:hypothetical protein